MKGSIMNVFDLLKTTYTLLHTGIETDEQLPLLDDETLHRVSNGHADDDGIPESSKREIERIEKAIDLVYTTARGDSMFLDGLLLDVNALLSTADSAGRWRRTPYHENDAIRLPNTEAINLALGQTVSAVLFTESSTDADPHDAWVQAIRHTARMTVLLFGEHPFEEASEATVFLWANALMIRAFGENEKGFDLPTSGVTSTVFQELLHEFYVQASGDSSSRNILTNWLAYWNVYLR
jgi:hypothetical protein